MAARLPDVTEQAMARDEGAGRSGRRKDLGGFADSAESATAASATPVYFLLHSPVALALGVVQLVLACAMLALGFVDMAMRRQTALVQTRIPIVAGALLAVPGVLALSAGFNKNINVVLAWLLGSLSAAAACLAVLVYAALTLHFSRDELAYIHSSMDIFVFNEYTAHDQLARGANAALLVTALLSMGFCGYAAWFAIRCLRHSWVPPHGVCCSCLEVELELGAVALLDEDDDDDDSFLHTELSDLSPDPGPVGLGKPLSAPSSLPVAGSWRPLDARPWSMLVPCRHLSPPRAGLVSAVDLGHPS
ncbi:unnamed protein product [Lampetra fluviatilis]